MKLIILSIVGVFFACLSHVSAEESSVRHSFLCIDNHQNKLILVDQFSPASSWEIKVPKGSRDLQQLDKTRILVSHGTGAREYDLTTGKALDWKVDRYRGIQSAQRLKDGNTVLLQQGGMMITVGAKGEELSKVKVDLPKLDLRLLRVLENGNRVIGAKNPQAVLEVSPAGKVLANIKIPGKGYKAIKLKHGNYLSSTGDEVKVVELDASGKIIRYVGGKKEHPKLNLDFNSGWELLSNGNIIMANWLGHNKHGTAPHLIEFDINNQVVWTWSDHQTAKQITNVKVLR